MAPPPPGQSTTIIVLLARLRDPAATVPDVFGSSVAVSGTTAVVGAYGTDQLRGAAYVYEKSTTGWPTTPTVTLHDPAAATNDSFGYSVAASGSAVVIGAPGYANSAGAAYVYVKGPAGWPTTPTVTLQDPGRTAFDSLGSSVAVSATAVVVGAPGTSNSAGAIYVYEKSTTGWPTTPTVTLHDPAAAANDSFGYSVASSSSAIVIGAPGYANSAGAAYVYMKGPAGWPTAPTVTLQDPAGNADDSFGSSVAVSGKTVVAGATPDDSPGVAYLYSNGVAGWPQEPSATLHDPRATTNDAFAQSVGVSGTTAVVGAPVTKFSSRAGGAVYGYVRRVVWTTDPILTLRDPVPANSFFGSSVAVSGATAVVGAPSGKGAAYVYAVDSID